MLTQSKGKIFISEERGLTEVDWFRSYNTFNFGQYRQEHKAAFGALYVLNEDTLAGGRSLSLHIEEGSEIMLIPVVGAIQYEDLVVSAGQLLYIRAPRGLSVEFSNPYETETVKFLQIWYKNPGIAVGAAPKVFDFGIDAKKNRLVDICIDQDIAELPVALIGKFMGRSDANYHLPSPGKGIFAFVIEGAFEVQYRLMNPGDGLALWGVDEINMEALSNDAIILLLEVPLTC